MIPDVIKHAHNQNAKQRAPAAKALHLVIFFDLWGFFEKSEQQPTKKKQKQKPANHTKLTKDLQKDLMRVDHSLSAADGIGAVSRGKILIPQSNAKGMLPKHSSNTLPNPQSILDRRFTQVSDALKAVDNAWGQEKRKRKQQGDPPQQALSCQTTEQQQKEKYGKNHAQPRSSRPSQNKAKQLEGQADQGE